MMVTLPRFIRNLLEVFPRRCLVCSLILQNLLIWVIAYSHFAAVCLMLLHLKERYGIIIILLKLKHINHYIYFICVLRETELKI